MRFGRHGSNTPNPETLIRSGGVHTLSKAAAAAMRSFRLVAMQPRSVSAVLERLRDPESAQLHHLDSLDLHNAIQIGRYTPAMRRQRIRHFLDSRKTRNWTKKVKYGVRKDFADSRLRVKGRFLPKADERFLLDVMYML